MVINYENYETKKITDVAHLERAKKNKAYKKDCILIGLSATSGEVIYKTNDGPVETKYAVIQPCLQNNPEYLYYSILEAFPEFFHQYHTGMNLQFENLKYLKIKIHPLETQREIVKGMNFISEEVSNEEKIIEAIKEAKKYFLENMFVQGGGRDYK